TDEFRKRIEAGDFIEWEEVYQGMYYGTLRSAVENIWSQGRNVIFDVDVKGGVNLKKYFGDKALSVFVKAPSLESLRERLVARGTETPESLERRLQKAGAELAFEPQFDVTLVNDDCETACRKALEFYRELKSRA
ncbi:MAG: guanylate kinase, partial [Bacteroidota bacterium]